MSEHTPGPWIVAPGTCDVVKQVKTEECLVWIPIASMHGARYGMSDVANAALVAAAPDLLKVVKKLLEECGSEARLSTRLLAEETVAKAEGLHSALIGD